MINLKANNIKFHETEILCFKGHKKSWNFRQMKKAYKRAFAEMANQNPWLANRWKPKHIHLKWLRFEAQHARKFEKVLLRLMKSKYL